MRPFLQFAQDRRRHAALTGDASPEDDATTSPEVASAGPSYWHTFWIALGVVLVFAPSTSGLKREVESLKSHQERSERDVRQLKEEVLALRQMLERVPKTP